MTDSLGTAGVRVSRIGRLHRQLILQIPGLESLDLRMDESDLIQPFFDEGGQSFLDGTLADIQSARVYGGDATVKEDKYGHFGDCFSELRALAKTVVRDPSVFKGAASSGPNAKEPSLHE